jgi:hypothetical protein
MNKELFHILVTSTDFKFKGVLYVYILRYVKKFSKTKQNNSNSLDISNLKKFNLNFMGLILI